MSNIFLEANTEKSSKSQMCRQGKATCFLHYTIDRDLFGVSLVPNSRQLLALSAG
jgi:hypothetical protein